MNATMQDRLREAMRARQMTSAQLARASRSTTATIANWLTGNVVPEHVKASQLFRIADALEVDAKWLLLGEFSQRYVNEPADTAAPSHPLKSDVLRVAAEVVFGVLRERGLELPPPKLAQAIQLAYELLDEGLPQAKVIRFVKAAAA